MNCKIKCFADIVRYADPLVLKNSTKSYGNFESAKIFFLYILSIFSRCKCYFMQTKNS